MRHKHKDTRVHMTCSFNMVERDKGHKSPDEFLKNTGKGINGIEGDY